MLESVPVLSTVSEGEEVSVRKPTIIYHAWNDHRQMGRTGDAIVLPSITALITEFNTITML